MTDYTTVDSVENKRKLKSRPQHNFGPAAPAQRRLPAMSTSRRRLLEILRAQSAPTTLGALAFAANLHENTVREHLSALLDDQLVSRFKAEPDGRGRPAWLYEALDADTGSQSEYAGLASALALTLHERSPDPVEDALNAGRSWGHELAKQRHAEPEKTAVAARRKVVELLDDMGFAPEANDRVTSIRLTRCPLLEAAHKHPEIVCAVHTGLTQAVLEDYGENHSEVEILPFSEPGACRLRMSAGKS